MLKLKNVEKVKKAIAKHVDELEKNRVIKPANIRMEFGKQFDESNDWEAFFSIIDYNKYIVKANYDASNKKSTFVVYKVWSGVKEVKEVKEV